MTDDSTLVSAYNTLTGVALNFAVRGPVVTIGRAAENADADAPADENRISLPSRLLARDHAVLKYAAGAWMLQSTGLGAVLINDREIDAERLYSVDSGGEFSVGEYTLVIKSEQADSPEEDKGNPAAELTDFLRQLHAELLEKMNMRGSGMLINLEDVGTRDKIAKNLERILDRNFKQLSRAALEYGAREFLYRRLSREVAMAGSGSAMEFQTRCREDGFPALQKLNDLTDFLAEKLALEFGKGSMESDTTKIDIGFEPEFQQCKLELSRGFMEALALRLLREDTHDLVFGLGPIQDLVDMETISEIMVVSKEKIYIEKYGIVEDSKRAFISDEALLTVIERIVSPAGRRIDRSSPMVDARLANGSRVNAVIPPLAVKGPCLTIRKFSKEPISIDQLVEFGAISSNLAKFLRACVIGKLNIVVSGGTGSGKTTLLNALSSYIPRKERIVTIEDTAELQLQQQHVITLESRPANLEGKGAVTIQDLVKNALRMRPDRIVVGECRGAEALDMLQAMNTGHDGSMTTGHANAPREMIGRLETMVLMGSSMPSIAIREQIVAAVDLIIQLNRESSGRRLVTHVSEVTSVDDETGQVIVEDIFVAKGGGQKQPAMHTGYIPRFVPDLLAQGILDMEIFY